LISTRAGGVGLNITSANKVVVVDPNWNPAYDLQAQDRAYRIGQTRDVEVFRLVSGGTIEEIVYARQIYKQQQANIGYNASEERRYFRGVMDESSKKGELFGLENLFTFHEHNVLLRDIMHQTNVAESRAGVHAIDISFDDTQPADSDDDAEADILSNKSLGLDADDANTANIRALADSLVAQTKSQRTRARDPVAAILTKAGVAYTHENSEVIGRSEVEARLGRQAMELRNDISSAGRRVFKGSQSQSQSQPSRVRRDPDAYGDSEAEAEAEADEDEDADAGDTDFHLDGDGDGDGNHDTNPPPPRRAALHTQYRYRPPEDVRRRLLCGMAQSMGFEDVVEFALLVEQSSQEERRRMLDRFYRGRRRAVERL
jgi:hypothetical protein